ncbi:hypothetical protein FEM48_Zijuj01G0060800 [Ziziphus jujuba var. spinosa]|uniref:Uncharacterized protein n=1 Tax=Ziziphus jujuba var. spinosa TaxID=714518 RepID=A0A978VZJ9_ZIZJJ|nr:hypothetical protein FEM48_Zijuj01G0060800 [Ziziphus jujuba var. spinosa]
MNRCRKEIIPPENWVLHDIQCILLRTMVLKWESSMGEESDDECHVQYTNDDDKEHSFASGLGSKLQTRSIVSKACWNPLMEMAEVIIQKGSLWKTSGIVRSGMTYCFIEEVFQVKLLLKGVHKAFKCKKQVANRSNDCVSSKCSPESGLIDLESKDNSSIIGMFCGIQINESMPNFDVYLPNKKFRKSSPGDPSFILCFTRY